MSRYRDKLVAGGPGDPLPYCSSNIWEWRWLGLALVSSSNWPRVFRTLHMIRKKWYKKKCSALGRTFNSFSEQRTSGTVTLRCTVLTPYHPKPPFPVLSFQSISLFHHSDLFFTARPKWFTHWWTALARWQSVMLQPTRFVKTLNRALGSGRRSIFRRSPLSAFSSLHFLF